MPGMFDDFADILRGVTGSPGGPGSLLGEVFAGFQSTETHLFDQVKEFGKRLASNGLLRWQRNVLLTERCEIDDCQAISVDSCVTCGAKVCLAHAHVSHRGTCVCDACVSDMLQAKGKGAARDYGPAWNAPPPKGAPAQSAGMSYAQALRVIGVPASSSFDEIQAAYRKKAASVHPDRASDDKDRVRREAQMKKLNEAFSVVKSHRKAA